MPYTSNSLRNVPMLIVGYNRPDFLKKRLLEASKMSVKKIYVSVDGGLESRSPEMLELLRNAHSYFKDSQEVVISHHKSNLGLTNHISQSVLEVLKENNFLVIVEDDVILSENFYNNMLHGLGVLSAKKAKGLVCAFSPISVKRNKIFKNKWRNTCYFSCWGWACSKETWQHYSNEIGAIDLDESFKYSKIWKKLTLEQKMIWFARFKKVAKILLILGTFKCSFFRLQTISQTLPPCFDLLVTRVSTMTERFIQKAEFLGGLQIAGLILNKSRLFLGQFHATFWNYSNLISV